MREHTKHTEKTIGLHSIVLDGQVPRSILEGGGDRATAVGGNCSDVLFDP